jgi:hypothetical protein
MVLKKEVDFSRTVSAHLAHHSDQNSFFHDIQQYRPTALCLQRLSLLGKTPEKEVRVPRPNSYSLRNILAIYTGSPGSYSKTHIFGQHSLAIKLPPSLTTMSGEVDYGFGDLMDDPEDYCPPTPPPTSQVFTMQSGKPITLHLVGASPTEAHHLWNGAKMISDFFEEDPSRVKDKTVLELGAAAGLPSLVAAILGARKVVVTDYPDPDIISTMQKNVDECDETVASPTPSMPWASFGALTRSHCWLV